MAMKRRTGVSWVLHALTLVFGWIEIGMVTQTLDKKATLVTMRGKPTFQMSVQ